MAFDDATTTSLPVGDFLNVSVKCGSAYSAAMAAESVTLANRQHKMCSIVLTARYNTTVNHVTE